jgi:hypothetical protein
MKKIIYTTKTCYLCNSEFTVKQTCKVDFKKKFCSKTCSSKFNGSSNKGKKRTEEWKQSLKEKNSGNNNPFYGKKHSIESKEKISKKNTGKKRSEQHKKKISIAMTGENNPFYGKKHTEESRAKISENHADHSGENNPNFGNGEKIKGEKNPSWLGGVSYREYGIGFSEELKTKIRKRDSFLCYICKKHGYDVHHIDYNKINNLEENLITLCRSCHAKTNFNRDNWIEFFKILKKDKICQQ